MASPDIVTIKTANVTGQSSWGTVTSTSYYDTTVTSTEQVEANNSTKLMQNIMIPFTRCRAKRLA